MNRENVKLKRTAIGLLSFALMWMFLQPVQAFAQDGAADASESVITETVSTEGSNMESTPQEASAEEITVLSEVEEQVESTEVESPEEPVDASEPEPSAELISEETENEDGEDEGETAESEDADQTKGSEDEAENDGAAYLAPGNTGMDGEDWKYYENGDDGNAIQQAVDAAIAAGQKYITVVVQDGTYSGGLVIDNSGVDANGNEKESIVVNIVAHDAYAQQGTETADDTGSDETGNDTGSAPDAVYPIPTNSDGTVDHSAIHSGSTGGVKLEGGVSVKNVELLLAGIYLTLQEQKENQGKIESLFTEEGNTDVTVEGADNFTYYGTAEGDSVNISLSDVGNAVIDSGDGDDSVTISATASPNVDLDTGKPDDTLNIEFAAADSDDSEIHVSTGDGNDTITVTHNSSVSCDGAVVSVHKGRNILALDTGSGADTVTLQGGTGLLDIAKDVSQAIAEKVYNIAGADVSGNGSAAQILGGEGDDLLTVDTTWELGTLGKTEVDYQGGDGDNRLHLSGSISEERDDRVSGTWSAEDGSGSISMYTANTVSRTDYSIIDKNLWLNKTVTELTLPSVHALDIIMQDVAALTDDLSGKQTVEVTIESGKVMAGEDEVVFRPFTDYVFDPDEDAVDLTSFANDTAGGLLCNLIVLGQKLTVGKDVQIRIPGVTLVLKSVNGSYDSGSIVIEGYLEAENIMLNLTSTDSNAITILEKDEETIIGLDPSIMDVNTTATVTIAETAQLLANRVVDIQANSIQNNGLLPDLTDLIPGLGTLVEQEKIDEYIEKFFGFKGLEMLKEAASINFVSIKMASALIDIMGNIIAGAVRVSASNTVDVTASNSVLRDLGLPFALSVILGEAGVTVSDGSITANSGDIYLDATSELTVNTTAQSGRLPFTVAVSVIDNKAYVDICGGTLKSNNGSIIVNSSGIVNLKTEAVGSNVRPNNNAVVPSTDNEASNTTTQMEMGKSGGFFAISVVNQDVFAALRGAAEAIANGDISVTSNAKASVVNKAASNPEEDGESLTLVEMIKTLAGDKEVPGDGGLVGKVIDKITSYFDGKENQLESNEEKAEAEKQKKKKTSALGGFLNKLTGEGEDSEGDDVGSLVDKATSSANSGKTDSTQSVQLVGSVAVTYANNDNKAFIETDGEVYAEGQISVVANGEMSVETLADGSPVEADDPAGDKEENGPQDQHYPAHSHGVIKVDSLTNGTIIMDASVEKNKDGIFTVKENNKFPKGIDGFDVFNFVVKACFGYKLQADEDGKYWITNAYKRDSDNSDQTDMIEVEFVGTDANGCYLYMSKDSGYGGCQVYNGENLFKAEFVTKHSLTVENNAEQIGTVEFSNAQTDGKKLYYADHEEMVYVTVNIKSGVTFTTPVITYISDSYANAQPFDALEMINKDGNVITDKIGDVQEDGTTNYYYRFKMPNGKVTMVVNFSGDDMNIKLDLNDTAERNSDVWITTAEEEPSGEAMDADAVYAGKVGDKVKIVIQLANNTFLVKNSLMFAGKTPVYIKDITYDGENQYTCFVNIPAILKTEGDETAGSDLKLTFQTTIDPNEAQDTVEDTSTALGAGLAVDVTRYNNQAYITRTKNNTITAGSLVVKADTAKLSASATSKAGFVAGDLGVAGAITVHLVSANNEALIGGDIKTIELNGGDLVVDSVIQNSSIKTNAEAAGDNASGSDVDPDSVGVGAGIAVGVSNLAVVARILDTVTIGGSMDNMNINAGHSGAESMTASAGASGGTSAVPVLALNISGVSVLADSGRMLGNVLNLTGDAVINAANSITRTITADAAAVGGGVGVGASFIIDILNDSAQAKLGRSVKTNGNLKVSADSVSRLEATAKSGAQGSVSEADGEGGDGDSGASGEEPPPSGGSDKDNKEELPDDYYEGLDNLFGEGSSDTELDEDDDAESLAPLFKEGDADQFVDSNKQSAQDLSALVSNSNGNVNSNNVGNAFENRQKAETSEGSVQVAATMVLNIQSNTALAQIDAVDFIEADGSVSVTTRHDTDGVIMADASATNSTTGVGVAVAINTVTYSNVAQVLTNRINAGEVLVQALVYEAEAEEAAEGFFESIKNDVLSTVEDIKSFIDSVLAASEEGSLHIMIRNYLGDRAVEVSEDIESGVAQLIVQWIGELLQGNMPSFPTSEQEDKAKEEIVAFAKDIFSNVKEKFSIKNLKEKLFGKEGLIASLKKSVKDINLLQKATDAVVSYLAGKLGGNEEAEGVGPKISTSAASGAGASDVGVAGSVAISVVKGTSQAYIADVENGDMTVSGNITIESKASQDVYTSAGASVDALGRVEKNKDATDTANSSQSTASNKDAGKSVGVGAAVAMSFADLTSDAGIGSGWTIIANDLLMESSAENNVETTSVSGTDPLARTEDPSDKAEEEEKNQGENKENEANKEDKPEEAEKNAANAMDYAVDASVSVTLIQNSVKAYLAENSVITLGGNLNMLSSQSGETNTNASGFAMGNETAVGAAVAINLAFSDVMTQLLGNGTVAGSASLDSITENQDDANALALAMGADMDRYMEKLRNAEKVKAFNKKKEEEKKEEDNKDEGSDKDDGQKEEDKKDGKIGNETGNKISSQLKRASAVGGKEKEDKSDPSQPLSVQAIKSQNVKTESTNQTDAGKNNSIGSTVTDASNANNGTAVSGTLNDQAQEGQSIHVAASVGVNVTAHSAKTQIGGNLTVGGLKAEVENSGNFSTASTGAAISEAPNSNCVGAAVAVSVNGNKAMLEITDGIRIIVTEAPADETEEDADPVLGNVALNTVLNQNSTGDALGRYGVLAVSGSSSGKGGKVGLAGSIAVLVAKGTSAILLGNNVTISSNEEGAVSIEASDKSKLSAAAMAATKSGGAAAGVGASFALLYAQNEVLSQAGDNFSVSAGEFTMTATKQVVDITDFSPGTSVSDFLTVLEVDSNGNGGYSTDDAGNYGMIVLQKNANGSYSLFTNLDTANMLELIQLTSVLASVNYYASAVAGTVMERKGDTSNQKVAVAGAVSMLFNDSVTRVMIGNNGRITTSGDTIIKASSETNTRLLGGALSSSAAKTGIGLNVATAVQKDKVFATLGNDAVIEAAVFQVNAESVSDMLVITAAAVNASGTSVGGAMNVVINDTGAKAAAGDNVSITASDFVEFLANVKSNVALGSVTVSISGSIDPGASVGAIVSATTNASAAEAVMGDNAVIDSGNSITFKASNEEQVISVLAAVARSGNGGAGAGTVSVLTTDARTLASVGNGANLTAQNDIVFNAASQALLIDLMLAAAASTDAPAVGATIMVNVFNRETGAYIGSNSIILSKQGSVLVQADSKETAVIISIAGAAASQNAISGNIQVNVGNSKTYASIGDNAIIKAWDSIGVTANQDSTVVAISPTVTIGSGSTAVGATVQTNILGSEVKAIIGKNANLIAYAQPSVSNGVQTANRETKRKGIILSALAKDLVVAGGVSAGAGKNTVAGVVETMVNKTFVLAKLGANTVVKVGYRSGDAVDGAFSGNTPSEKEGELSAESDAHSTLVLFGGAFSASSSTGVGATVLTLVYDKNVDAQLLLSTTVPSYVSGNINVIAGSQDLVGLVSVNFGVSNSSAANAGGNVLIFQNAVNANLAGHLTAAGNVTVQADSITNLINAVASVSGSLGGTSASGAALVTYFQGTTNASVADGSVISCVDLSVLANSSVSIDSDGVGLTVSAGSAAVSGLVNIIVTSTQTKAFIGAGSRIVAEDIMVVATDHYDLLAVAVSLSGGSNGIGVTAVVTVAKNTVLAYIGDNATIQGATLNVQAISNRNIRNYAGSVSAGSSAGAGVTVMVAVIGGMLDQDSANGIAKGFNPNAFMSGIASAVPNAAKSYLATVDPAEDLAADDSKASDLNVGDENGNYDGADDYRSDDFDEAYMSGSNPGENFSEDVTNAEGSELGMQKPQGEYKNVINAYIGSDCVITVTGAALIEANEKLNVDIVTASGSVGGTAGVNVGVAVVVAYSNVLAEVRYGTVLNCADLTVHAISGGDGSIQDDIASEVLGAVGLDAQTEGSSIRAIAITVGIGGTAGVSPSVAVVNMASASIARMDGVSGNAGVITVKAETLYPQVLAVTGAVGIGGTAGVSASVAVVTFNSDTYAGITSSELAAAGIHVLTNVDNTAKAYAMSLAGGTVGVNGGVAVVTNRSTTVTVLNYGDYAVSGNVNLKADLKTDAESFIVGFSLGGVAVGLNAAVVNQHAIIVTQILGDEESNLVVGGNVNVSNDVAATAKTTVVTLVGGGVGVGGNVLLVFNNMEATAAIINMPFQVAGNVTIKAGMNANSEATLSSGTIGGVAVGISTSYVGLNARNLAYLEIPEGVTGTAASVRVYAGSQDELNSFDATASTLAGGVGAVNVSLNAAVADIHASNEAKILSKGTLVGSVDVQAEAAAAALAEIYFASAGGVNVSAATVVSVLRIRQLAEADIAVIDNFNTFHVSSVLNEGNWVVPSHALLITVSGGMYNASVNVAVAYSLSQSVARAILHTGTNGGDISVDAIGSADAKSETLNQSGGMFSGSVAANVAYANGQFQSELRIMDQVSANNATVQSVYTANSNADLTPSASKLDLSIYNFNVNMAIARTAAKALAALEGTGKLVLAQNLLVLADGSHSGARANIEGATVSISGASFGVNVSDSQLALEQTVSIRGVEVEAGNDIRVLSDANKLGANAQTGSNSGVGATVVGGETNTVTASVNAVNKIVLEKAKLNAQNVVETKASSADLAVNAIAKALTAQLSGINAAVTVTTAEVTKFNTGVFVDDVTITGSNVEVLSAATGSKVIAQSSVPMFNGSVIGLDVIVATAEIVEKLTQVIINAGDIHSTVADVVIKADASAFMKADSARPAVSMSAISIRDYVFTITVNNICTEVLFDGQISAARHAYLTAYDSISGDILMNDTTIGGFTGTESSALINVLNQTAQVKTVGEINAVYNILLQSKADQRMYAQVNTNSVNFNDHGYAKTDIIIHRNSFVYVDGKLISVLGNIDVNAQVGTNDSNNKVIYLDLQVYVDTWIDSSTYPTGTGELISVVRVNVAEGSLIQAQNVFDNDGGTITIVAKTEGHVLVNVYRYVDKLIGGNRSYSIVNVKDTVATRIGDEAKTRILGKNVNIRALAEMDVRSKSHSEGNTSLSIYYPNAAVTFRLDLDTMIRAAEISAKNVMNISAYLPSTYVLAHCISEKDHWWNYNAPSTTVRGNIYGDVTFDNNTTLRATTLNAQSFKPADTSNTVKIERWAESYYDGELSATDEHNVFSTSASETISKFNTKGWTDFSKKKKFVPGNFDPSKTDDNMMYYSGQLTWGVSNSSGESNPSGSTDIYVGTGAAGTYVDIDEKGQVRVQGNSSAVSLQNGVYHVDGSKLQSATSYGTFNVKYDTMSGSGYNVVHYATSSNLNLTNRSQYTVQLDGVNQSSDAATVPGAALNVTHTNANADLIFNGGGNFSYGTIYVHMAGGDLILKNGAALNTNRVYILGAGSLVDEGRSDGRFQIINNTTMVGSAVADEPAVMEIAVKENLDLVILTNGVWESQGFIVHLPFGDFYYQLGQISGESDVAVEVKSQHTNVVQVRLGTIRGNGTVTVKVPGRLETQNSSDVHITGDRIVIEAGRAVGGDDPIRIDSQSGVTVQSGGKILLEEVYGDMIVEDIVSTGNGRIHLKVANGSILSHEADRDLIKELDDLLFAATELQQQAAVVNDRIEVLREYLQVMMDLAEQLAEATAENALELLNLGRAEIDILHEVESIEEALEILESNIRMTEEEIDALDFEYLMLILDSVDLVFQANDLQNQIKPNGIATGGDVILNVDGTDVSIGSTENMLGISCGGQVELWYKDTSNLDVVALEGFSDLYLKPIYANTIMIYTMYNVYASKYAYDTLLTADNVVIRSALGGDLGTVEKPLAMDANTVNLFGKNISVTNNKSLLVDLILAMQNLNLGVKGDLDYIDSNNVLKGIYATSLNLNVSGDVGQNTQKPAQSSGRVMFAAPRNTQKGMLINVDEGITISAKNACLEFAKTANIRKIYANGDLTINSDGALLMAGNSGAIYCDSLNASAFGRAGTEDNPLRVYVRGGATAESDLYGENLLVRPFPEDNTPEDNTPEVRVTGNLVPDAVVTVDTMPAHTDCVSCEYLIQRALKELLTYVHIHVDGEYTGKLQVEIAVEGMEDGTEVIVLLCRDGIIYAIRAEVRNGFVTFLTEELGAFLVLGEESELTLTEDEKFLLVEETGEALPFGGWL